MRHKRIAGILACIAAGAVAPAAHAKVDVASATWMPQRSVAAMRQNADIVVRGTVTSITNGPRIGPKEHPDVWMPTRRVRLSVDATLKGAPRRSVVVRWIAGIDPEGNHFRLEGDHAFRVGERATLFLNRAPQHGMWVTVGPDGVQPYRGAMHVHRAAKPKAKAAAVQWWDTSVSPAHWVHVQAYTAYDGQWWLPVASIATSSQVLDHLYNDCLPWYDYYTDIRFDGAAWDGAKIRIWDASYFGDSGIWGGTTMHGAGAGSWAEIAYNTYYLDSTAWIPNYWYPQYQTHWYADNSVVCHELGHAMGLWHDMYSVMGSFYNYYWDGWPNATDVQLIQYMYDRYNYT